MESRTVRLKKKRGRSWVYQEIEIPTDEEMDRIAAELHAKHEPALINVLGWQVFYNPGFDYNCITTKVDPFNGAVIGDKEEHSLKTKPYCVFGYESTDWKVSYSWNNGDDQSPIRQHEKGDIVLSEVETGELDAAMLNGYKMAGEEIGYWGNYFLRSVKQNGGLSTAKRMLRKKPSKGFRALIEAGRLDLSLESLVLQPRFHDLFTKEELAEAKRRLDMVPDYAKRIPVAPDENYPDDLQDEKEYVEGAKKRITVNAYERDPKARKACLKRHGYRCAVCTMNFQEVYGKIGEQFIHVHHKKPLAGRRTDYAVKPTIDLIPVCPNCHAMLHTSNPPLGIAELKQRLDESSKAGVKFASGEP